MRKIMIIVGHPQNNTFCEALGKAYKAGAESAGHEARLRTSDPIIRLSGRRPYVVRHTVTHHRQRTSGVGG